MLDEPVELGMNILEEEQKNSAYQIIQTIFLGLQEFHCIIVTFMVQNITLAMAQSDTSIIRMYHVLFATFPTELQLSWFLLSLCAHYPGPGSTTAI